MITKRGKIAAILLVIPFLLLLALYAIAGEVCRAVFYLGQGWACHFIASSFFSLGSMEPAVAFQRLSIKGYESALSNLESSEIRVLIADEWGALLNMYILRHDLKNSLATVSQVEKLTCEPMQLGPTYEERRRSVFGETLLCHARILFNLGRLPEAAARYREVIADGEGLIRDKLTTPEIENRLALARKELASDLKKEQEAKPVK